MSMYTRIDIENPDRPGDHIADEWLENVEFFDPYSHYGDNDAAIEENSKYQNDEVHSFAKQYTERYVNAEVTIREEWTGEGGPTIEETTYRSGEAVDAKRSELVPGSLRELIEHARRYVSRDRYGDVAFEQVRETGEAIMALLDALDPEGVAA